ncbi:MAG: phospholipid carrier-dependent glycosyltransferase [Patescibacteria group bacterium]
METKKYIPVPYEATRARSATALRLGLIILALSLITRFAFFSHPAETVFDEVHFGKFVSGYFTGEYFFDIHPPLGKLIVAATAKVSGFQPGFSFENIGQQFPDETYKWLRFLPKLAGTLLPLVVFLLAIQLGISQKFAFLAGLLIVFENALLTQSRFILLDSFLLLFGFLSILFYLKYKTLNTKYLFLAGVFAALAFSIKWTGLTFLGLILIFYLGEWLKNRGVLSLVTPIVLNSDLRPMGGPHSRHPSVIKAFIFLILIPFLIYFLIFAIHFLLLDQPGPGLAFHPPDFQEMNIFEKFIELNSELYQSNARLTASHPYSSPWYQWPFMTRPIYYWNGPSFAEASEGTVARIYLLGNPLVWWASTIAVLYSLIFLLKNWKLKNWKFLISGYLLNLLPFIFIGRVMFLYHYFPALIFAILILCFQLDNERGGPHVRPPPGGMIMSTVGVRRDRTPSYLYTILIGAIILFLFFSPLSYGLEIPEWYYKMTVWLPSWR